MCDHAELIAQQDEIGREPVPPGEGGLFYLETCSACGESVKFRTVP
jgi:hypothetical protein